MADSKFSWSENTYRLDELGRSVGLPQLIQVTEGYDTGSNSDSFSAEDIFMIDQCVILQKVAAQFAEKRVEIAPSGSEYAILKDEILIPLNYKGKLKVVTPSRRYNGVWELAREFPRYATVLDTMRVSLETGGMLEIKPGSKVELDRVIPAQKNEGDRLVINTDGGGCAQVALPFDAKARFRSCPDDNEYTLKEVIDRYSLTKIIQFLDNKIQKIYTQDLLEGVEQMANVTASALQINRVVLQKVLIGHYTEPESVRNPSEKFCKRTLLVIPFDSPNFREIAVKIRLGDSEEDPIYEPFLVHNIHSNKSDYADLAVGLYVEFAKQQRIIRLQDDPPKAGGRVDEEQKEVDQPPPPVPPRPGQPGHGEPPPVMPKPKPKPTPALKMSIRPGDYIDFNLDKEANHSTDNDILDDEDYEVPENPPKSPKALVPENPPKSQKALIPENPPKSPRAVVPDNPPKLPEADHQGPSSPLPDQKAPNSKTVSFPFAANTSLDKDYEVPENPPKFPKVMVPGNPPKSPSENQPKLQRPVEPDNPSKSPRADQQGPLSPLRDQKASNLKKDPFPFAANTSFDEDADYEIPENPPLSTKKNHRWLSSLRDQKSPKSPVTLKSKTVSFPLADISFEKGFMLSENFKKDKEKEKHVLDKFTRLFTKKSDKELTKETIGKTANQRASKTRSLTDKHYENAEQTQKNAVVSQKVDNQNKRPVASLLWPQRKKEHAQPKEFRLLTCNELEERLNICGMPHFAKLCYREKIDGEFLHGLDKDTLKTLGLSTQQVQQLNKIIAGWMPTS